MWRRRRFGNRLLSALAWLLLAYMQTRLHLNRRWVRQQLSAPPTHGYLSRYWRPAPQRICAAVVRAARWMPGATCLPQALSAYRLLRRFGYDAEVRIGVATTATGILSAHAWVEHAGSVVIGAGPDGTVPFVALRSATR